MGNLTDVAQLEPPRAAVDTMTRFRSEFVGLPSYRVMRQAVRHQTLVPPSVELLNIPFNIREEGELVHLVSPQWPSLQTFGRTAQEAIDEMLGLVRNVVEEYVLVPESELSEDALEFRRYLIQRMLA
ncbi:MAG: hypothetical protein AABY75_01905 [Bacteroidota bacterium]